MAVDLQEMVPIAGVTTLQGDITRPDTAARVVALLGGRRAQLVVSDGAPDVTGLHDLDEHVQGQLLLAALGITRRVLAPGGTFVAKVFRGRDTTMLYAQFRTYFRSVVVAKPRASRNSSFESFIVCRGFAPPDEGDAPSAAGAGLRAVVPFVACGDLSGLDSDASYPRGAALAAADAAMAVLAEEDAAAAGEPLPPVAPPIRPPHRAAADEAAEATASSGAGPGD